ncbi:hypothetical protein F5890DRAFT_1416400, partial [Lentinula detonsa]
IDLTVFGDISGRVVIVTGGETRIGLTISQALVENGAKLYNTGRRINVLEETAKNMKG